MKGPALPVNSEQTELATHYFDELCGNTGLNPLIPDVKGDPDTLIKIAQSQREMLIELQELRAYKKAREEIKDKPALKECGDNSKESKASTLGIFSTPKDKVPRSMDQNTSDTRLHSGKID